jgi:hypothetical protein
VRGAYAIARHEFLRRWPLVLVGLGLGLLVLALSAPDSPQLARLTDMLVTISVVVSWIIAFMSGMSLIGRPLHDGRLSFYFTRPIASSAIVIGKVVGGGLAITCMHVALVVPLARAFVHEPTGLNDLAGPATFVGIAFFFVGLVIGILARSRSRWFVIDIVGAAVAALIAVLMFAGFGDRKANIAQFADPEDAAMLFRRANAFLTALIIAAALALFVAVVVAITRGRTDRDLVHRSLSTALWPLLTAVGVIGLALAHWGLR